MNLLECLSPAFSLLSATVALVILGKGLTTLVAFNTSAAVIVSLFLLAAVGKVLRSQDDRRTVRPDLSLLQTMLQYAIKFYISIMAGFVIFRADLLIVNYFRGPAEAGVYAVASQVSFLLLMLPGVIATLLFPRVASQPDPAGRVCGTGNAKRIADDVGDLPGRGCGIVCVAARLWRGLCGSDNAVIDSASGRLFGRPRVGSGPAFHGNGFTGSDPRILDRDSIS